MIHYDDDFPIHEKQELSQFWHVSSELINYLYLQTKVVPLSQLTSIN